MKSIIIKLIIKHITKHNIFKVSTPLIIMLKSKKISRNNIIIFSILITLIISFGIYFSVTQSAFDNDAEKHYTWYVGEDVIDGYDIVGTNILADCDGIGCIDIINSSQYIDINYIIPQGNFTISTWVNPRTTSFSPIFYNHEDGAGYGVYSVIDAGKIQFVVYNSYTTPKYVYSGDIVSINEYSKVDLVYTRTGTYSGAGKIYYNGELVAENTDMVYDDSASTIPKIGGAYSSAYTFNGTISDFSIYERILNATEIASNYEEQKIYFINYNLEIEHSKEINVNVENTELCSSVSLNDLYNKTTCKVKVDENATIEWTSDTKIVTNPVEDLTIFMDEDKSIILTDEDKQSSGGSSGGSVPDVVEEVIEPIIENVTEQSLIEKMPIISDGFDFLKEYWEYFASGILLIGIAIGYFMFKKINNI